MSKNPKVDAFLHKLFGTTPGEGMQPKEAIAYSVAGFGQNFICTIIGSYLTVFMTDAPGFDLNTKIGVMSGVMAVAWLMLGTRIFDAFNDPIMGSIVDRTRTKWGKCRPYLKWMAIPIGVVTILCFLPWYPKTGGGSFGDLRYLVGRVYGCGRSLLGTFFRNDKQHRLPRKNADSCASCVHARRRYRYRFRAYYYLGRHCGIQV